MKTQESSPNTVFIVIQLVKPKLVWNSYKRNDPFYLLECVWSYNINTEQALYNSKHYL